MFSINLKVLVAMETKLCTYSISAMACQRFASCIPVLILKCQRHNFSQIIKFSVIYYVEPFLNDCSSCNLSFMLKHSHLESCLLISLN